ncbi:MAG: SirB2 family protein [Steroidobacteraceae bacterium]
MMDYATLKLIHVSAVAVSGSGFAARGLGAWNGAAWVRGRVARTLPHLVDTVLLLSALGMLWTVRLSPWALPWLRAKIIGLVFYIVFGAIALRRLRPRAAAPLGLRGPGRPVGLAAWVLALLIFGYIISVALTKSPLGVFSL